MPQLLFIALLNLCGYYLRGDVDFFGKPGDYIFPELIYPSADLRPYILAEEKRRVLLFEPTILNIEDANERKTQKSNDLGLGFRERGYTYHIHLIQRGYCNSASLKPVRRRLTNVHLQSIEGC